MRLILRATLMAAGMIGCVPLHYASKLIFRRSPWPRLYLKWAGWSAGLRVRVEGVPLRNGVLFVSNHVSWLDILAIGGATGAVFVSRDDVEHWPVVGWIANLNDTIYVARQARREVHGQADRLRRALAAGRAVALFPEGTTEGGHVVLPFRPSLLASLFPPIQGVRVQPVAIDYGDAAAEIAWAGDEAAGANAKRILSRPGSIPVVLKVLAAVEPTDARDRKALAARTRAEVVEALGASAANAQPLYAGR
jgi:1-acyl-sn-glycerol-3-phosphate acyltransferase